MGDTLLQILLLPLEVLIYGSGLLFWPIRRWVRRNRCAGSRLGSFSSRSYYRIWSGDSCPPTPERRRAGFLLLSPRRGCSVNQAAQACMVRLRPGGTADLEFLREMLFEAFFWDTSTKRPSFASFRNTPEFSKLLAGWGRRGDRAIIAEQSSTRIGAAWFRLWTPEVHSYGFVDAATPEVAMAVRKDYRSKGLGRRLLDALIQMARTEGLPALSLSVSPSNFARQFYESAGFRKVGESGTSWTFLLPLTVSCAPVERPTNRPQAKPLTAVGRTDEDVL